MKAKKKYATIGDKFNLGMDQGEYILCQVGFKQVAAISINSRWPNRWNDPVAVEDINNITKSELKQIIGCCSH